MKKSFNPEFTEAAEKTQKATETISSELRDATLEFQSCWRGVRCVRL